MALSVPTFDELSHELSALQGQRSVLKDEVQRVREAIQKLDINQEESDEVAVLVKNLNGATATCTIPRTATIAELKEMVKYALKTPCEQQRLLCRGQQLLDYLTVSDYEMENDTIVHLVLRLRGGMYHESSAHADLLPLSAPSRELVEKKALLEKETADLRGELRVLNRKLDNKFAAKEKEAKKQAAAPAPAPAVDDLRAKADLLSAELDALKVRLDTAETTADAAEASSFSVQIDALKATAAAIEKRIEDLEASSDAKTAALEARVDALENKNRVEVLLVGYRADHRADKKRAAETGEEEEEPVQKKARSEAEA